MHQKGRTPHILPSMGMLYLPPMKPGHLPTVLNLKYDTCTLCVKSLHDVIIPCPNRSTQGAILDQMHRFHFCNPTSGQEGESFRNKLARTTFNIGKELNNMKALSPH